MAASGDHLRRQGSVERRMPLRRQTRIYSRQVVKPREDFASGAIGTAAAGLESGADRGLPVVTLFAAPPDPFVALRPHLLRRQRSVFRRVPLARQSRQAGCQIVFSRNNALPPAHRATASIPGAGVDRRFPLMSLFAPPPDSLAAARADPLRRQRRVARRVPLRRHFWVCSGQIVKSGKNGFIGAIRAAMAGGSGKHLRLPLVALISAPPDLLMATVPDGPRRQRRVFFRYPFRQQSQALFLYALFIQAFFQRFLLWNRRHPCFPTIWGRGHTPPPLSSPGLLRGRDAYFAMFSQKRIRIAATCARDAMPFGTIVVSVTPVTRPAPFAQRIASTA